VLGAGLMKVLQGPHQQLMCWLNKRTGR
jgi:hypothetical protein